MTTTMTQAECLDAIIEAIGVDVTSKESAAIDRILTQFVTDTKRALIISSTAKVAEIIEQAYAGVVK
jgi:hypothetical protein